LEKDAFTHDQVRDFLWPLAKYWRISLPALAFLFVNIYHEDIGKLKQDLQHYGRNIEKIYPIPGEEKSHNGSREVILPEPSLPQIDSPASAEESEGVAIESWIDRIIQQESRGNPKAVSPVGARGLMQIMPATWKEETKKTFGKPISFDRAFEPNLNKQIGTQYLKWIKNTLRSWIGAEPTIEQILSAYNGGVGRLRKVDYNWKKMPPESVDYVQKITGKLKISWLQNIQNVV